jgi:hypothetical protein
MITEENKKTIQQINIQEEKVIRVYRLIPFDWNIIAEIVNAEFDTLLGKPTKQTIFQSNPALRKIYDEMDVPKYSLDEVLELAEGTLTEAWDRLNQVADEDWNVSRWRRMSIEERSVYLGKTKFVLYATPSKVFVHQSKEAVSVFEKWKAEIALQLYEIENGN